MISDERIKEIEEQFKDGLYGEDGIVKLLLAERKQLVAIAEATEKVLECIRWDRDTPPNFAYEALKEWKES